MAISRLPAFLKNLGLSVWEERQRAASGLKTAAGPWAVLVYHQQKKKERAVEYTGRPVGIS